MSEVSWQEIEAALQVVRGLQVSGYAREAGTMLRLVQVERARQDAQCDDQLTPEGEAALAALVVGSPLGLPVLAPEVQLLYKAKSHRPKDEHDFAHAFLRLSAVQRAWLAGTLRE